MENEIVRNAVLAIIMLPIFLSPAAGAQQTGTTAKPAEGMATPSATTQGGATTAATAPSKKVVLKVGATQVTQSEIDFVISNLNPKDQQALAANGRRAL